MSLVEINLSSWCFFTPTAKHGFNEEMNMITSSPKIGGKKTATMFLASTTLTT